MNAIAVGSTATSALDIVLQSDELRTTMEAMTPLGRLGEPEDIAAAVLCLASPAGSFLTGKVIESDGGLGPQSRPQDAGPLRCGRRRPDRHHRDRRH